MPFDRQPHIDLSSRDWGAIIEDFTRPGGYLETRFGSEYTEFRDTELGAALIELVGVIGDAFNYAADQEGNESNLVTARQIQSVLDFAMSIGYDPSGSRASTAPLLIETPGYNAELVIPAGRRLLTNPSFGPQVVFEVATTVIKAAGTQSVEASAVAGESIEDPAWISNGDGRTRVTLQRINAIQLSDVVTVDGAPWTRVSDFSQSTPTSTHYRVVISEEIPGERRTMVEFGDGSTGRYPTTGQTVIVRYRVGGGVETNVPKDAIDRFESAFVDSMNNPIVVTVRNTDRAVGGLNPESIDQIRMGAPSSVRMNNRLVSNPDYEDAARRAGAIRAVAVTKNEYAPVEENTVLVFVAKDLVVPTDASDAAGYRSTMLSTYQGRDTRRLVVVPCTLVPYAPVVNVFLRKTADPTATRTAIVTALTDYFAVDSVSGRPPRYVVDIGVPIRGSRVSDVIDNIDGVSYLSSLPDLVVERYQMPTVDPSSWTINLAYDPNG